MTLTRREFLATSGSALAVTAVALAWPPARAGAAAMHPVAEAGAGTTGGPSTSSGIERQRRFHDGALRPVAWSRRGRSHRLTLCDAERIEITTPDRGHARLRIDDPRARDAIARGWSPSVLREVLAEAARLRAGAGAIA